MSEETWGPWIDGTVPPPVGAYIQAVVVDELRRGDMIHECVVLGFEREVVLISPQMPVARAWSIDRYRIRKPRGLTILENLIADLPAPVGPKVDA